MSPAPALNLLLLGFVGWVFWMPCGGQEWWQTRQAAEACPLDPAFLRLSALEEMALPLADRFDQPLGSEHAALTYNAQPFRINRHLGDDLNGIGGGNSDRGDPVYASAAGRVVYSGNPGGGWGNMIILAHRLPSPPRKGGPRICQTVYAHLETRWAKTGDFVPRGLPLGTVGTADGLYPAHLHFEIREGAFINPAQGYADSPLNRLSPGPFIRERRGAPNDQLNPAPKL